MPNRLADQTSPYLLQHADNPVDWWPWCDEAFAEARERDVPVLLSVGYAACHWCHVMAHESFDDPTTAAVMNEYFVCIKVDREERPDIDHIYLTATQALSGQGGWPMTAFLTPDAAPFYCGTYFPPAPSHGMPGFRQVLTAVISSWRDHRDSLVSAGQDIVAALTQAANQAARPTIELTPGQPTPLPVPDGTDLIDAARRLRESYDQVHGGFGTAPKFPASLCLLFLLRHHARLAGAGTEDRADSLGMVEHTCERMARGGIYDQLAGGFARYSVDERWSVPHFEKMLYDNALLVRVYLALWRETGSVLALRVATETADFLLRELRTPDGGFASALDADTDGVEGRTYVWTPDQLTEALGADDAGYAAELLDVTDEGTFEHGTSVLRLPVDPVDTTRWARVRTTLLDARARRPQPARDDKVVTGWNGLAIAALAELGAVLGERTYTDAAIACGDLLLGRHLSGGRLCRASRNGRPGTNPGALDDYGDLAEGLLMLHQATGEARWLAGAGELLEVARDRFVDSGGGFYDTPDDADALILRPADPTDNPTPSGRSSLAGAALSYAALTGASEYRELAEGALRAVTGLGVREPRVFGWGLAVAEAALSGPVQVAVSGNGVDGLTPVAWRGTSPGVVVVSGRPDTEGAPLLAGRKLVRGKTAAYVCRGFVCDRPTTDERALAEAVRARVS